MSRKYKFHDPNAIYSITPPIVQKVNLFTKENFFEIIMENLKYYQKNKGLVVHAYCIMTNHLHLIISRNSKYKLEEIIRDFKKFTAVQIIKELLQNYDSRENWMLQIFNGAGLKNSNNTKYQIWQQHNHPIELSDNKMLDQRLNYVHNNPVKAGFVEKPEDWKYSSARSYAGLGGELELEFIDY